MSEQFLNGTSANSIRLLLRCSVAVIGILLDTCNSDRTTGALKAKGDGSPYSITERRVPELIPVLGSQPASDVSHKPGGRLPLLSARPVTGSYPRNPQEGCYQFCCLVNRGTMGVSSLPKTVTRQHRDCDLNPGLLRLSPAR